MKQELKIFVYRRDDFFFFLILSLSKYILVTVLQILLVVSAATGSDLYMLPDRQVTGCRNAGQFVTCLVKRSLEWHGSSWEQILIQALRVREGVFL